ncbi:MAG: UbiA-like polyprenyltransferase [Candidatus Eisenbacteria bacterium]
MSSLARPAVPSLIDRARTYARFVKIEHALFSLPLILAGALLAAPGGFALPVLGWIALAATGARTAALALNRLLDRAIDARNPRTRSRELPSGVMTLKEGWGVAFLGAAVYGLAAWRLNSLCLLLSPIPLVVFAVYPLLKRVTPLCHFGVGAALALSPLGGYLAVSPDLGRAFADAGLLALFTLGWVAGFDIIYATLDVDFDRASGVHSLPAALGAPRALYVSLVCHSLAFAALTGWALVRWPSPWVAGALALVGAGLAWQQKSAENVDLAFFRINAGLGFAVLLVVIAGQGVPR